MSLLTRFLSFTVSAPLQDHCGPVSCIPVKQKNPGRFSHLVPDQQSEIPPRGPRLSTITTVSHYRRCGGHRSSGDRKHHPPLLPQWAVRTQKALSKAWTQANSSIHDAVYGRCLGERMEGCRSAVSRLQREPRLVEVFHLDSVVGLIRRYSSWGGVRRESWTPGSVYVTDHLSDSLSKYKKHLLLSSECFYRPVRQHTGFGDGVFVVLVGGGELHVSQDPYFFFICFRTPVSSFCYCVV